MNFCLQLVHSSVLSLVSVQEPGCLSSPQRNIKVSQCKSLKSPINFPSFLPALVQPLNLTFQSNLNTLDNSPKIRQNNLGYFQQPKRKKKKINLIERRGISDISIFLCIKIILCKSIQHSLLLQAISSDRSQFPGFLK